MAQPQGNTMQLAEILSDLVSLRVCDPGAALALVSARSSNPTSTSTPHSSHDAAAKPTAITDDEEEAELKRAKDLLRLHYEVKEAHKRGELGRGLEEARGLVRKALGG